MRTPSDSYDESVNPDFAGLALQQYEVPSSQDCYPPIRPEKQGCATGYCLISNMIEFSILIIVMNP